MHWIRHSHIYLPVANFINTFFTSLLTGVKMLGEAAQEFDYGVTTHGQVVCEFLPYSISPLHLNHISPVLYLCSLRSYQKGISHSSLNIIFNHFPGSSNGEESTCRAGSWLRSLGQKSPRKGEWLSTPVFLPRELHGQRSLVGYSPWSHKESDMTE